MKDLTLEEFEEIIKVIQKHEKDSNVLTKIMLKHSVGIIDYGFDIVAKLVSLLQRIMGDEADWVAWWLYEDVEKLIYTHDKTYDVTEIKDLYYFLKGEYEKVKGEKNESNI